MLQSCIIEMHCEYVKGSKRVNQRLTETEGKFDFVASYF